MPPVWYNSKSARQTTSKGFDLSNHLDLRQLPENLPVPMNDGACDHLYGVDMPDIEMNSTHGKLVSPRQISFGNDVVLFCYPMTGRPGTPLPDNWDHIPGARGCTPQVCSFRDEHNQFMAIGVCVLGLSTQDTAYQSEVVKRLHIPYPILSDASLNLVASLSLPTFVVNGMTLIARTTLILRCGKIVKVFYPVFPPDQNVQDVLYWLSKNPRF